MPCSRCLLAFALSVMTSFEAHATRLRLLCRVSFRRSSPCSAACSKAAYRLTGNSFSSCAFVPACVTGRLADVRRHGAYRFNAATGEKEFVDGGGASMFSLYFCWFLDDLLGLSLSRGSMVCVSCLMGVVRSGMDRVRQFGATDFIDSGASARPNVKADGLPEGFDMSYARQKYEAGVPAGNVSSCLAAELHPLIVFSFYISSLRSGIICGLSHCACR